MKKKYEAPPEELIFEYEPKLTDLHNYYENFTHKGKTVRLVGNHEMRVIVPLVFGLRGVSVVIKGASGSGKTTLVKGAAQMLWGDKVFGDKIPEVLYMAGASKKGWLTNSLADRIQHRCTHAVAPELQNVITDNQVAEAMVKLWTEGEPYTYTRADNFGRDALKLNLEPLPLMTSIATENPATQKLGEEMERRFFPLYTVASREMNEKIHISKAEAWALPDEDLYSLTEEDKMNIRAHLQTASQIKKQIKNPCAPFVRSVIPHTFVISDSMIELFFESIAAVTKFHYSNRMSTNGRRKEYLLSTPADNWYGFFLAGEPLVLASMNIPDMGKEIVQILPLRDEDTPDLSMSTNEIVDELSSKGFDRTRKQVDQIMKAIEMANYAKRDEHAKDAFYRSKDYDFERSVDWAGCLEEAKKIAKTSYKDISKDYIHEHCDDPIVYHPFTGEKLRLLDMVPETPQTIDIAKIIKESGK